MPQPAHVTFFHGLANKPAPEALRRIWLEALAEPVDGDGGFSLDAVDVSCSFVYWADLFYDEPSPASQYESMQEDIEAVLASEDPETPQDEWAARMKAVFGDDFEDAPYVDDALGYERIPLPGWVKKRAMKALVREAHDYLFDVNGIRTTIRQRALEDFGMVPDGTRHVVVGHSQGSFIAYDVLTGTDCKPIEGLLTLGSPLGLDEIQDRLVWTRDDGFPAKLKGSWINVFDSFDVVSRPDPRLAGDFKQNGREKIIDVNEQNWGRWRHSATKYFKGPKLRGQLRMLAGRDEA